MKFITVFSLLCGLAIFSAAHMQASFLRNVARGVVDTTEAAVDVSAQVTGAAVGAAITPVRGYYENAFQPGYNEPIYDTQYGQERPHMEYGS